MESPSETKDTAAPVMEPCVEDIINTNAETASVKEVSNDSMETKRNSGVAKLKPEFVMTAEERVLASARGQQAHDSRQSDGRDPNGEPDAKRPRQGKEGPEDRRRRRGQNKARPLPWREERTKVLCQSLIDIAEGEPWPEKCGRERCDFIHDMAVYLASKPADLGPRCQLFHVLGRCPRGASCRYGGEHLTVDGHNKIDAALFRADRESSSSNMLSKELQFNLRKFRYDFGASEKTLEEVRHEMGAGSTVTSNNKAPEVLDDISDSKESEEIVPVITASQSEPSVSKEQPCGPVSDEDLIKLKSGEKKTVVWRDKLYLSPLTTLGNLPFRRICKGLGADVTCGEMAMASSLLQGAPQEWALVRRHECEDIFGVQLCGCNPHTMAKCAQLVQDNTNVDFVDINMGCPIDLVYHQGAGSGLLRRRTTLETMVRTMSRILTVPLTIKTRTGVSSDKNLAHTFMPSLKQWGVSLVTLHGRSREQRYTRSADWAYIDQCAQLADPVPLFGNGDILSYEDYNLHRANTKVAGVMVGRGALIKPWIFTEIKEQRHWDISSGERLDMLKKYVNFGLEHWGTDTKGVENTRRFLLEWLSFLHRYIPVGLLEHPPQHINERPPAYKGRNELESLMVSPNSADWVTISEMLLGKVPDGFNFLPKHKANSWQ